jgi:hypothetical protein
MGYLRAGREQELPIRLEFSEVPQLRERGRGRRGARFGVVAAEIDIGAGRPFLFDREGDAVFDQFIGAGDPRLE